MTDPAQTTDTSERLQRMREETERDSRDGKEGRSSCGSADVAFLLAALGEASEEVLKYYDLEKRAEACVEQMRLEQGRDHNKLNEYARALAEITARADALAEALERFDLAWTGEGWHQDKEALLDAITHAREALSRYTKGEQR